MRYTPSAIAALPHTPDGEQLLVYPWQNPDDRKAILDEMAAEGAHSPRVQWIVRGVIAGLAQHLRRMPTPREMVDMIKQLQKELAHVTWQRDVLKKAAGILSEKSQTGMP